MWYVVSVLASVALTAFVTWAIVSGYYQAKERAIEEAHQIDIDEKIEKAIETHRRRQLMDARRENMPRSDAGEPAVVRPAFSRIPPRNS